MQNSELRRCFSRFMWPLCLSSMVVAYSLYSVSVAAGQAAPQWQQKWDAVLKAAQAEGKVVVA